MALEIRSDRVAAFFFDTIKIGFYFILIFYALKMIREYTFKYLTFIAMSGSTIDYSPLQFLISIMDTLFEHFLTDFVIVLSFTLFYTLKNRYVFSNGFIYAYKGFIFVKERTIPYQSIAEIDYDKTLFNMGDIIIRVKDDKKPLKIAYLQKVEEIFNLIKKETGFDKNEKNGFFQS